MSKTIDRADLERLGEEWHDADLDDVFGQLVTTALDRVAAIRREYHLQRTTDGARRSLAERLAHGEIEVSAAIIEWTTATRDAVREARRLIDQAEKIVLAEVVTAFRKLGDSLLTEHLQPRHDALMAEAVKLAPLVANLVSDEQAIASDRKARDAWVRLGEIYDARRQLLRIASRLRQLGIIRTTSASTTWRHPEAVPSRIELRAAGAFDRAGNLANARLLAEQITRGAGPCVLTAAEAEANEAQAAA